MAYTELSEHERHVHRCVHPTSANASYEARCLQLAVGALNEARDFYSRFDAELAKGVAQVSLNGLRTEKELGSDLGIGLSIDDEASDLKFALGE